MSNKQVGRPTSTEPMLKITYKPLVGSAQSKQFRTTAKFENVVEVVEEYLKTIKT